MEKIIVNPERVRCYGNIMMEHSVDDYTLVGSTILVDSDTVMGAETTVYSIEAESSTLSVVLSSSVGSCSIGDTVTLSATVLDDEEPVEGGTVTFKLNTTTLGTDETDASGVASYTYTTSSVGSLNFTAYYESHNSNTVSVVVSHDYSIAFDSSSYTTSDGNVTAYVTLLDNSNPVSGASISLTGTGSTLSATTNSSGIATFNLTGISSDCTLTATYDNVSDTATVTVQTYLFYDDCSTDSSSRYTKADTKCSFTYDSNGYYVLSKTTSGGTSGIKINDTTFPKNVKITVDVYMTTNANTQPKLLFKNPSATYGYTPRLTYINNKASIIQGHYTGEGSSITGDVSYTQSLNTWYTFEFIHNDGALTFNIYKEGTLDKTLTATGSLSIADTGNEVGMCVAADSGKTYRFKNLKVEAL